MAARPLLTRILKMEPGYPVDLRERLRQCAPETLFALGNVEALQSEKIALFCSIKCPGKQILQAYDLAQVLRDAGKTVISGFHSPIEKECLALLLRGKQPIIICPARSLEGLRLPVPWKEALTEGRLLLLSPFSPGIRRVTADLAQKRNTLVAALADEACFVYATPGGNLEKLRRGVAQWGIPILGLEDMVSPASSS